MSVRGNQLSDQDHLLKIGQVAKRLNVAPNTVRNAIESGHLFAYLLPGKGRGTYRVPESSVERYLSEHVFHPADQPKPRQSIRGRPFKHLVLDDEGS
ncbi:MAG: helix-turn-helix domain-containing protein [Isosphaeraceae bacterium]